MSNIEATRDTRAGSKENAPWYTKWWVWVLIVAAGAAAGWLLVRGGEDSGRDEIPASSGEQQSSLSEQKPQDVGPEAETPPPPEVVPEETGEQGFPAFDPLEFVGEGPETLNDFPVQFPVAVSFDCPDCTATTRVSTDAPAESLDAVLLDRDGPAAGTYLVGADGDQITQIVVEADSRWTLLVQDLNSLPIVEGNMDGMGSNAFIYRGPAPSAAFTALGEGKIVIQTYPESPRLLADEAVPLERVIDIPNGVIAIDTIGDWSFEPQ